MLEEARAVMRMSPTQGLVLGDQARAGDAAAARRFVLYAGWKAILRDKSIPVKARAKTFLIMAGRLEIDVVQGQPVGPASAPGPMAGAAHGG
jgi:hypothetical protein